MHFNCRNLKVHRKTDRQGRNFNSSHKILFKQKDTIRQSVKHFKKKLCSQTNESFLGRKIHERFFFQKFDIFIQSKTIIC